MTEPSTAQGADKPCEMYRDHGSVIVSRTQGHHIYPVYLQNRVYGQITLTELIYLCGTCHDATHDWLYWLMGERRKPDPEPALRAKALAVKAHDWFIKESSG